MGQLHAFLSLAEWHLHLPHRILTLMWQPTTRMEKVHHCFDSITSIISLHCTEQSTRCFWRVKNCQFTPLSLCALRWQLLLYHRIDDKVACPVWEHHHKQQFLHIRSSSSSTSSRIQEHTPKLCRLALCTFIYLTLCFHIITGPAWEVFPQYSLGPILTKGEINIMALHASKLA